MTVDVAEGPSVVEVTSETNTSALAGMVTGQKDHDRRSTDQYRSRTSRRKPTARRLEIHSAASFRAYRPLPKQAEDNDTAGLVTKLMGIWPATSRSLYTSQFSYSRVTPVGGDLTSRTATQVASSRVALES